MNYCKQIAEMLGVELNEEFKLYDTQCSTIEEAFICRINGEGIQFRRVEDLEKNWNTYNDDLIDVLIGNYEIVKIPWKPKATDYYYYSINREATIGRTWRGEAMDFMAWKLGNCFRTKEEAETKGKEIMEQIQKEYEEA